MLLVRHNDTLRAGHVLGFFKVARADRPDVYFVHLDCYNQTSVDASIWSSMGATPLLLPASGIVQTVAYARAGSVVTVLLPPQIRVERIA